MKFNFHLLKYFFLLLFLYASSSLLAQQTFVKGVISIQNSQTETGKKIFVRNAQVVDNSGHAQPVITDDSGRFVLIYVDLPNGISVHFNVKKPSSDLQVVNISSLTAVTGQNDVVKIAMAPIKQISEYRETLYKVGVTTGEKRLRKILYEKTKELTFLTESNSKDKVKLDELTDSIKMLRDQQQFIDSNAIEFAKRYSEINLDDASPYIREAIIAFQKGSLDSALNILQNANLENKVKAILSERKDIRILADEINRKDSIEKLRTEDISNGLILQTRLFQTNLQFDSAAKSIELLLSLDPKNGHFVFNYAEVLSNLHQNKKSLKFYLKALTLFQIDSTDLEKNIAKTYLNIGSVYQNLLDFDSAKTYYKRAKQISLNFERNDSSIRIYLAAAELNLGSLYLILGENENAKKEVENSIKLMREEPVEEPEESYSLVASLATNARLNLVLKDTVEAEKNYLEAVKILEGLIKNTPKRDVSVLAAIYNDLGGFYFDKRNYAAAEKLFKKALSIYDNLNKEYHSMYAPDIALEIMNLGVLFSKTNFSNSKKFLDSALNCYKELMKVDKETYEPNVANVYHILSELYFVNNNFEKGEKFFSLSENITKRYEKADSNYIIINADYYKEIGSFYYNARNYKEAIIKFDYALFLYKKLANYQIEQLDAKIHNLLNLLGNSYLYSRNFLKAKDSYIEDLSFLVKLSNETQGKYYKDEGEIHYLLGIVYDSLFDYNSAIVSYNSALKIYDSLYKKNKENIYFSKFVDIEMDLAQSFLWAKNYPEAEQYFKKSLENVRSIEFTESKLKINVISRIERGLADTYFNLGDLDKCEFYTLETLTLLNKNVRLDPELISTIVTTEINLGAIYLLKKDYKKGEKYLLKALSTLEKDDKKNNPENSVMIANIKLQLANLFENDNKH